MDCTTKTCTKCKADKPLSEFNKDPRYKFGVTAWCTVCLRAYHQEHHKKNADKAHARNNARSQERWHNDPEYRKKKNAQKKISGQKPELQAKRKMWDKARYERDKADPNHRVKRRPMDRVHAAKRRAWKKGNGGTYTLQEWQALCDKYGNKCLKCGKTGELLHVDHVIPLARGGRNDIANLQPLCGKCNRHKSAKHIDYRPND
jgi:5-methylcytosine-specific restriction endonuclease McrA